MCDETCVLLSNDSDYTQKYFFVFEFLFRLTLFPDDYLKYGENFGLIIMLPINHMELLVLMLLTFSFS